MKYFYLTQANNITFPTQLQQGCDHTATSQEYLLCKIETFVRRRNFGVTEIQCNVSLGGPNPLIMTIDSAICDECEVSGVLRVAKHWL